MTCLSLLCAGTLRAQEQQVSTVVLATSGYWRIHYTFMPPVLKDGQEAKPLPTLTGTTVLPPKEWMLTEFDDANWLRQAGRPLPGVKTRGNPDVSVDCGAEKWARSVYCTTDPCGLSKFCGLFQPSIKCS